MPVLTWAASGGDERLTAATTAYEFGYWELVPERGGDPDTGWTANLVDVACHDDTWTTLGWFPDEATAKGAAQTYEDAHQPNTTPSTPTRRHRGARR